ncbi:multidrug transporter, putative [Cryptococcus deneoformans JEC21]|uniref:Multidrug transporter, putative n=1 Tax=Cryptococcus deneoformans (strain JEC21 / ATCC MYA-565) TaxID=214684 RepID=Q5K986_CRYD1|nr:multidrug transporter, putative [Cryptococcus neoformans var. neoformans JEC21]AAW46361.1 multidrug transporter, putative [Cryptococcus neoformans var. neoformans JEC21]
MSERTPLVPKISQKSSGFLSNLDYVLILPALLSNNFFAAFESTIAASTQGAVGTEFNSSDHVAWVAISYLTVSTAVQPLYGRASDLFGRTRLYVLSLAVFALGCLGCGLSNNLGQMIAARAICGIGGGGLITVSQVCAWDVLPMRLRPLYQAANNVTYGLGAALGASLGGILSDSIGWRFAYFFPVPLTIFSIVVFLCRASPKLLEIQAGKTNSFQKKDIDSLGSVLLMTSITLFMLVINLGGSTIPWSSSANPILLVFSVITTLAFFQHEKRVKLPVLPINLLTNRRMVPQVGLNLFGAMTIFGTLYLIPVFFQTTLLTSASVASRRLLYPTLTAPIASIVTGIFLHCHRRATARSY